MFQLSPVQALQIGWGHHQAGRFAEAEALYRTVLAAEPEHAEAMHLLGLAVGVGGGAGRREEAIGILRRVVALKPTEPAYLNNLGKFLTDAGRLEEAAECYRAALRLRADFADAHYNLGCVLRQMGGEGTRDEAMACFERAIACAPNYADAHNNLGIALRDAGRLEEAVESYRAAVRHRPAYPEAWSNLGNALHARGRWEEAEAACREALRLRPGFAEAHNNLGNVLLARGRPDEAAACYRQALRHMPWYVDAMNNLGSMLKETGLIEEAVATYRSALALRPGDAALHSNIVLGVQYHPGSTAESLLEEARLWYVRHGEPLARAIEPHGNDRTPNRRLRIGYVSADLRDHAVGRNLVPLLAHHDHGAFEIICFADGARTDGLTERLRGYADAWQRIVGLSDEAVTRLVREMRVDILVDLSLHTAFNRLRVFARKPAPVQVTFAGYPGTTGLATMDYRLTDPYLDPVDSAGSTECCYAETSVRLPASFWCYDPIEAAPEVNELPALSAGHMTFGCLNNFCKVNEMTLRLWAEVLRAVEHSRLVLLTGPGTHRQRTLDVLGRLGVSPERVEFQAKRPFAEYLALCGRVDMGLDTVPYNGHTTSLDCLYMGVPVVTLMGGTVVGRAGYCQLSNLGLAELAARTPEEFVRIAAEWACDLPRLAALRKGLRERMKASPLMDGRGFARGIEEAYRGMWKKWCEGQ